MNGDEPQILGVYTVKAGAAFEDYRNYASKRDEYTPTGYYSDSACTTPWDFTAKHPGGEVDTDIPVYISYIPGDWILVDSYSKLTAAVGKGNIYLTADIDCGGNAFSFNGTFTHVFEGNGHTISNFKVEKFGSAIMPSASIFQSLGAGAEIRNVSFSDVTYRFFDIAAIANKIKVAALARDAVECTVSNVSVSGTFQTNYDGDLSGVNNPFYEAGNTAQVTDFVSNITIEKQ